MGKRYTVPRKPITKKQVKKAGSLKNVYYKRAAEDAAAGATLEESYSRQVAKRVGKSEMTVREKTAKKKVKKKKSIWDRGLPT